VQKGYEESSNKVMTRNARKKINSRGDSTSHKSNQISLHEAMDNLQRNKERESKEEKKVKLGTKPQITKVLEMVANLDQGSFKAGGSKENPPNINEFTVMESKGFGNPTKSHLVKDIIKGEKTQIIIL